MATLYLTEKPSQVKPLKEALAKNNMDKGVEVVALLGHILAQMDFKAIDEDFRSKSWNELVRSGKVPFFYNNPFSIKYKKVSNAKFFKQAKEAIQKADKIILATDPDNEGATLGLEVIEKCGALNKVVGMVSMNKLDIQSLSKEVKTIDRLPYLRMYSAGQSRGIFDQLFGFNLTILATELLAKSRGELLNIGAVKLPTIRMVVERDLQFEKFKEIPYWNVVGKAKYKDKVFDVEFDKNLEKEELASQIAQKIKDNPEFIVNKYEEKNKKTPPPKPYSLTNLQSDTNKRFKYTAKKTLELAQKLYETHKVQSYPRTDNNYYAEGEYLEAPKILQSLSTVDKYAEYISKLDLNNLLKRNIFNDKKVTAHTALAPTQNANTSHLTKISTDEKKVFHLVALRYIIQFYPDYKYLSVSGSAKNTQDINANFGENIPLEFGWKEVIEEVKNVERQIPQLNQGDKIEILIDTIKIEKKFTKPKPRFTESSLLIAMEKIANFYDDEEVKAMLKESGIGTPATRANILNDLKKPDRSGTPYFKVEKNKIISTEKARRIISQLPDDMTSPKVRATIETMLKQIEKNEMDKNTFYDTIKEYIISVSNELKGKHAIREDKKEENLILENANCPICSGKIKESQKSFYCENLKYNHAKKKIEGCKFAIFKNQAKTIGRTLTEDDFKTLLNGKEIKGNGNILKLDLNNKYFTQIEWGKDINENEITESPKFFKKGERIVWKDFRGHKITKREAQKLFNNEKIALTLKSKAGKKYNVNAWLNNSEKIETEFA